MRPNNRNIPDIPTPKESTPRPIAARRLGRSIRTARRLTPAPAILGNERGVALVMALVLGLVGMLIITAILYMVGTGTWLSGSQKRYQAALDAAQGGMTFFVREIVQRCIGGEALDALSSNNYNGLLAPGSAMDFKTKLTMTGVATLDAGYPVTPPDATLTFTFTAPTPNMTVEATVSGTNLGNSGASANLLVGGGVVSNNSGTITPQHVPYLFRTDVQGQSAVSSREKANLSGIYAY